MEHRVEAEIKFLCGHAEKTELNCTRDKAESRAKWLAESRVCSKCYKEKMQSERRIIVADLPMLNGTEKQTAWANNLRAKLIQKFPEQTQEVKQAVAVLPLDAKWWIDHRDEIDGQLIERIKAWLPA
jgi:hypothetical protein